MKLLDYKWRGTKESLRINEESEKAGLKLNIRKTKITASSLTTSWQKEGEKVETVTDFIFLGFKITADGDCNHEIKRHLLFGRKAMTNLIVVWLLSRVWLFESPWTVAHQASLSFTISWSLLKLVSIESMMLSNHLILCHPKPSQCIKKQRHHFANKGPYSQSYGFSSRELDNKEGWVPKNWCVESWCWRRLLRVSWAARRSNQSILKEINPEYSSEGLMLNLKLQYFGHLMQRADSLEKTLMLGKIKGRRRMGQQRMRWLDGIID